MSTSTLDRLFLSGPDATALAPDTIQTPPEEAQTLCDLPISWLVDMSQPFHLYADDSPRMEAMRQSVLACGIIQRIVVRSFGERQYQIISGRHRRRAASLAGFTTVPCEVRSLSDEDAELQMLETNLQQREDLLPSERALAYKRRFEIIAHQGKVTCGHKGHKSRDQIAEGEDLSGRQIQRYISLANLTPDLLQLVDDQKLTLRAGVILSALSTENQVAVHNFFYLAHHHAVSEPLAEQLRELEKDGPLTEAALLPLLSAPPKPLKKVSVPMKQIYKYFPTGTTEQDITKTILAALTVYFKERQGDI